MPKAKTTTNPFPNTMAVNNQPEAELAVDVIDSPKAVVVQAAIAGIKPKDLTVSVSNSTLTIRGVRQQLSKVSTDQYIVHECYNGMFSRSVVVPFKVAIDAITAVLDKGILTVTIPRSSNTTAASIY